MKTIFGYILLIVGAVITARNLRALVRVYLQNK